MDIILRGYSVNAATWFYLSLLLIIAVFFRFNRIWSVRNLDLGLLLACSPGLLLIEAGDPGSHVQALGYSTLFAASACILIRLLADTGFTRRPQFTQNLNGAGLAFLCICAFVFLTVQAVTKPPADLAQATVASSKAMLEREPIEPQPPRQGTPGPAAPIITAPVESMAELLSVQTGILPEILAVRILAIVAHLAVVLGLLTVGTRLFGDVSSGWAMATLYLLLPCTAYDVGEFNHVLPAALVVWAVVAYRKPLVSGVLLGLAGGSMFFPVFLLPLWAAFYGRRGCVKFCAALAGVTAVTLGSLAFTSATVDAFLRKAIGTLDVARLAFRAGEGGATFWDEGTFLSMYRVPIIVAYVVLLICLTVWPRRKTVEHLIAHSAALIVGTQFWYTQQGGIYLLWYLPLFLMVVFRPRLAHLHPPDLEESAQSTAARTLSGPHATRTGSSIERMHLFR
ncbi:MAG: hypothetical protein KF774_14890 [Planctomyces sp.]|nr:hypothetical protein [Planctomyces sp.]